LNGLDPPFCLARAPARQGRSIRARTPACRRPAASMPAAPEARFTCGRRASGRSACPGFSARARTVVRKKEHGARRLGALRRWVPVGRARGCRPSGGGPPAKSKPRGDGSVSYEGALSHAGGDLATRRGGGVSSFGAAHGGAGGARQCGRTMTSQGGLGRLARGETQLCSRSRACCTTNESLIGNGLGNTHSPGRTRRGPCGQLRRRVTIATSRFSRFAGACALLDAPRDRSATLAA